MIQHNKPTIGVEEQQAANRVLTSGWLAQGSEVASFENEFCDFLGIQRGHAVAVTSGTAALYMALWALDAENKKISFPTYVCSALRNAVGLIRGKEVLIDNAYNSPNIDLEQLNSSDADITIIPHMFGIPADLKKIKCEIIIEDCCQALGAKINGTNVGLIGNVGIFSFYATKLITSGGQGGMVVSKDKIIIEKIRDYREFDQRKDWIKRFNFQMTDLQAAIGREQLKKLPDFLKRREFIFSQYKSAGLDLFDVKSESITPVRYRSIIKTSKPFELKNKLENFGIRTIIPIEDWELLGNSHQFSNAYALTQQTLSLPSYPDLSDSNLNYIIEKIISNT